MWNLQPEDKLTKIAEPTFMFDNCGAYDLNTGDGDTPINRGSTFPEWGNALSFLEWYGVPLMNGFGIIIIDDENPTLYV